MASTLLPPPLFRCNKIATIADVAGHIPRPPWIRHGKRPSCPCLILYTRVPTRLAHSTSPAALLLPWPFLLVAAAGAPRMLAMSHFAGSSGGRRQGSAASSARMPQVADPRFGEETGLPLVLCPYCRRHQVIERRTQQDSADNYGRIYIKCPRNEKWFADRCKYYRWQKAYLKELIEAGVIHVFDGQGDEEQEEVQKVQHAAARGATFRNLEKHPMEAKLEKMMNALVFLTVLVVGIIGVGVGLMFKQ